jgi:drug/metabolite transporter (DMT)-like permease
MALKIYLLWLISLASQVMPTLQKFFVNLLALRRASTCNIEQDCDSDTVVVALRSIVLKTLWKTRMKISRNVALGLSAGLITALIGASWQVVSRSAALTPLGAVELALLRYAVPTLLLLPITLRIGLLPKQVPPRVLLLLICGGGLPFGLLAFAGTRFAPAAHMGVMVAATGPLITAGLLWLADRSRVSKSRGIGLVLIATGVVLLCSASLRTTNQAWIGDIFFLLAAVAWGAYGIAFRKSNLSPWQAAAIVNTWSALLLVPIVIFYGADGFYKVSYATLMMQLLWQGVVAGVFGLVTYTFAVRHLGASAAAAFGALVPVLSALGGWLILSEAMTVPVAVAALLATVGVALAVGLFDKTVRG